MYAVSEGCRRHPVQTSPRRSVRFSPSHTMSRECGSIFVICFAVGDESQTLDTRQFVARPVDEQTTNTDNTVPAIAEVPLDKTDATNRYSLII